MFTAARGDGEGNDGGHSLMSYYRTKVVRLHVLPIAPGKGLQEKKYHEDLAYGKDIFKVAEEWEVGDKS